MLNDGEVLILVGTGLSGYPIEIFVTGSRHNNLRLSLSRHCTSFGFGEASFPVQETFMTPLNLFLWAVAAYCMSDLFKRKPIV